MGIRAFIPDDIPEEEIDEKLTKMISDSIRDAVKYKISTLPVEGFFR